MKDDLVSMGLPQLLQYCDVYEEAARDQPEEGKRQTDFTQTDSCPETESGL